jgi:predicted DNA-binding transcriptional regulator AlpA
MMAETQTQNDRLLRKKEAAERLDCSPRSIDRKVSSGRLTKVKWCGVRFRESEVQAIINGSGL